MTEAITSSVPGSIRAGDTIRWRRELSDFPASDGWQLSYAFVGRTSAHSATAVADGDAFVVTLTASATAAWTAGAYRVQETVAKGDERFTVATTSLQVLQDLAAVDASGADTRTHARKVLDALEAWLESKAPVAGSIEIAGRKISHYDITDLLTFRDRYRAEVRREEAAAAGRGSRLLVRI